MKTALRKLNSSILDENIVKIVKFVNVVLGIVVGVFDSEMVYLCA